MTRKKEIHILGLGSIGVLYSHYLSSQAGYKVSSVYTKNHAKQPISHNNNKSIKYFQEFNTNKWIPLGIPIHPIESLKSTIPILLITTKATDTKSALKPFFTSSSKTCINHSSILILLQNGVLGVYKELLDEPWFPTHENGGPRVILGSSSHGVFQDSPNHYIHTGLGSTYFGSLESSIPSHVQSALQDLTLASTLNIEIVQDPFILKQKLLLKLIVNVCINSLTCLFNVQNGVLNEYDSARGLIKEIIQECWPIVKDDLKDFTTKELENIVFQVCIKTSSNYNSMLVDIQRGNATEIDYILGYLIQLGSSYGLCLDKIKFLYSLVKFKSDLSRNPLMSRVSSE